MKALVTGGAGFIGSHVVRALLSRGWEVRVLHLPHEPLRNLEGLPVERVAGDVTDVAGVRSAVKGCGRVFHLAAIYALWHPDPDRFRAVNVEGTRNVLRAAGEAGVEKVVYTSSIAVFGGQGPGCDATEQSPFRLGETGDPYAISKYEAHRVAVELAGQGLNVTLVAPCAPLGPGDVGPTPTGRLLLSILHLPVPVVIDTSSNMIDVRDVAEGHILAAERGRAGESYLLGHQNRSLLELARMAASLAGVHRPILQAPPAVATLAGHALLWYADHVSHRAPLFTPRSIRMAALGLRADCRKAVLELNLPQAPIETAVRDALIWFARNGYVRNPGARERLLRLEQASDFPGS